LIAHQDCATTVAVFVTWDIPVPTVQLLVCSYGQSLLCSNQVTICVPSVAPACEEDRKRYEAFDSIYEKDVWGGSGWGSSVEWTATMRTALSNLTRKYEIKSFFDAPVGDFKWMPLVDFPSDMEYVGTDIVRSIVGKSRREHPTKSFWVSDIVVFPPFKSFDLIFCRDALQHLSMADIKRVRHQVFYLPSKPALT